MCLKIGGYNGSVRHIAFALFRLVFAVFLQTSVAVIVSMPETTIYENDDAREHFKAISTNSIIHDVVDSYATLSDKAASWFDKRCSVGSSASHACVQKKPGITGLTNLVLLLFDLLVECLTQTIP